MLDLSFLMVELYLSLTSSSYVARESPELLVHIDLFHPLLLSLTAHWFSCSWNNLEQLNLSPKLLSSWFS